MSVTAIANIVTAGSGEDVITSDLDKLENASIQLTGFNHIVDGGDGLAAQVAEMVTVRITMDSGVTMAVAVPLGLLLQSLSSLDIS